MASDLLELRRENTLSGLAADRLESLILTGQLPAGERINEAVLARELGISRGPIREGLRLLASRGLVEFIANKGAFVRAVNAEEMLEIYDLRSVLTGHACRLAAEHRTDADVRDLEERIAEMAVCIKAGDAAKYYALNLAFHDRLLAIAGGRRLESFTGSLAKEAALFRRVSLETLQDTTDSNNEHMAIVAAIRDADGAGARALGEAHVLAGKRRFLRSLTVEAADP